MTERTNRSKMRCDLRFKSNECITKFWTVLTSFQAFAMAEKGQQSTRHKKMGGHFGNQGYVAADASSPPACQLEVIHAKQWRRAWIIANVNPPTAAEF